jgi:hypothetical protein
MRQRGDNQSIQPYFSTLPVLSFVGSIIELLSLPSAVEEKIIRTNLMRQGFTPFHMSHHVSVRTEYAKAT